MFFLLFFRRTSRGEVVVALLGEPTLEDVKFFFLVAFYKLVTKIFFSVISDQLCLIFSES